MRKGRSLDEEVTSWGSKTALLEVQTDRFRGKEKGHINLKEGALATDNRK